jgi:hypothetical protein
MCFLSGTLFQAPRGVNFDEYEDEIEKARDNSPLEIILYK